MSAVTVHIANWYSDGHESTSDVIALAPEGDLDGWWEETVFPNTGDGHGARRDVGSIYTATITDAEDVQLVGESREWIDS